jgi:hypothetical protein
VGGSLDLELHCPSVRCLRPPLRVFPVRKYSCNLAAASTKAHLAKARAAKPRVLASP